MGEYKRSTLTNIPQLEERIETLEAQVHNFQVEFDHESYRAYLTSEDRVLYDYFLSEIRDLQLLARSRMPSAVQVIRSEAKIPMTLESEQSS